MHYKITLWLLTALLALALMGCQPQLQEAAPASEAAPAPVLVHQVYFWLKDKGNAAQIADLKAELAALTAIPHIQLLYVGTPASTAKRSVVDNSFDVSELMYFASQAEHDAYQVHPLHKAFADKWTPLLEKVIVYDSVLE
jgi:hypothetical protein